MVGETLKRLSNISLGVLVAVVLGFACWQGLSPQEPNYQGRTVSEWISRIQFTNHSVSSDDPAIKAIGSMDTKVLPYLIRELQVRRTPLYWRAIDGLNRGLGTHVRSESDHWLCGIVCLQALGSKAEAAVPELITIARDSHAGSRTFAIELLGTIRTRSNTAVPALLELVNDPDAQVSRSAQKALARLSPADRGPL
jgi:hypothetical protein